MAKAIKFDGLEFEINEDLSSAQVGDVLMKGRAKGYPHGVKREEVVFFGARCCIHRTGHIAVIRVGQSKFIVVDRLDVTDDWTVKDVARSQQRAQAANSFGFDTCVCPKSRRKTAVTPDPAKTPVRKPRPKVQESVTKATPKRKATTAKVEQPSTRKPRKTAD